MVLDSYVVPCRQYTWKANFDALAVFLSILSPVLAQKEQDVESRTAADGSPQPSVAAQSPTPQQPLREQDDGRRKIDGRSGYMGDGTYADILKAPSRSTRPSSSYADTND